MDTNIYGLLNESEKKFVEEHEDGYLKIKGYDFYISGNRYAVKKENEQVEIYSTDDIRYISWILDCIIKNEPSWVILTIENVSYGNIKQIIYEIEPGKMFLSETIAHQKGIEINVSTNQYELKKENLPALFDEAQKNGFLSDEQRKYLEGYIKL